jgi:hypothetical protein
VRSIRRLAAVVPLLLVLGGAPAASATAGLDVYCTGGSIGGTVQFGTGSGIDWSDTYEFRFTSSPQSWVQATMEFHCNLAQWAPGDGFLFTGGLATPSGPSVRTGDSCGQATVTDDASYIQTFDTPAFITVSTDTWFECAYQPMYGDTNSAGFLVAGHTYDIVFSVFLRYDWEVQPEPVLAGAGSAAFTGSLHPRASAPNTISVEHAHPICYETVPLALSNVC